MIYQPVISSAKVDKSLYEELREQYEKVILKNEELINQGILNTMSFKQEQTALEKRSASIIEFCNQRIGIKSE